jgi:hypothetical protein
MVSNTVIKHELLIIVGNTEHMNTKLIEQRKHAMCTNIQAVAKL